MKQKPLPGTAECASPPPKDVPASKRRAKGNAIPSPRSNYKYYQQYCKVFELNSQLREQVFITV